MRRIPKGRTYYTLTVIVLFGFILPMLLYAFFPSLFFKKGVRVLPQKAEKCLDCHKDIKAKLNLAYLHHPFELGNCLDCHKEHSLPKPKPDEEFFVATQKVMCTNCHQDVAKEFLLSEVHKPFTEGNCTDCHNPHASSHAGLLVKEASSLCIACHNVSAELKNRVVHRPFGGGKCADCHAPHASSTKGMLLASQKILCVLCHRDIGKLQTLAYQHQPVDAGRCTDCHEPHSSPNTSLLLASEPGLCYLCHSDIRIDFQKTSHHPIERRDLNCTSCHEVHASSYARLLIASGNNLCFTCHQDKRALYVRSAHNLVDRGRGRGACINCHQAHGAEYNFLLAKEDISLCLSCHILGDLRKNHPVGSKFIDRHTHGKLTCTSTCHEPHGTVNMAMLTRTRDGLCLSCHPVSELP